MRERIKRRSCLRQEGLVYIDDPNQEFPIIEVRRGCARAVRHYAQEFIETLEVKSQAQENAEATRLTLEQVDAASIRIDIIYK